MLGRNPWSLRSRVLLIYIKKFIAGSQDKNQGKETVRISPPGKEDGVVDGENKGGTMELRQERRDKIAREKVRQVRWRIFAEDLTHRGKDEIDRGGKVFKNANVRRERDSVKKRKKSSRTWYGEARVGK